MAFIPVLIPLAFMMVSDWRTRTISLAWLVVMFLVSLAGAVLSYGLRDVMIWMFVNISILTVIALFLMVYSRIRKKRLGELIGLGDALFFGSITPMFVPENYARLVLVMLVFSLMMWVMLRKKVSLSTIPLVTFSGIPIVVIILLNTLLAIRQWIN